MRLQKIQLTIGLIFCLQFSFSQKFETKPYWQQLKTDSYQGKQDDIYFIDSKTGWYCNGSGKIYKTTNGGTDWELIFEKKGTFFRCIGFIDSLVGFAGNIGIDYFPNVEDTVPLYKTNDGGRSWQPVVYNGPIVKGLCAIQIYKEPIINSGKLDYKSHVFCGGRVGSPAFTMISHDNGKTFQSKDMRPFCQYILDIHFFNLKEGIICAASNSELDQSHALIIRTKDGGNTWEKVYESQRFFELTWKQHFPGKKVGYVTIQSYDTAATSSQRYIAKTNDGGLTWKELPLVNDINVREFGVGFTDEKNGFIGAVPNGFETHDGGLSWEKSYMGPATNKIRIQKDKSGKSIAYGIGVIVSKNKSVIDDGKDVVAAMRNAYAGGRWYKNFSFSQNTLFYKEDGTIDKKEVWHEIASFPGKLLIKFNSKDSKDGYLFSQNKVNLFKDGKMVMEKPMIHDLLLTAFDVYFHKPYETTRLLDSLGYNLKLVRQTNYNGRKVYVVGAADGDLKSNQFWVDAERFYLHRVIYKQNSAVRDVKFESYELMESNWVAKKITFMLNGKLNMVEDYFDIKFPKEVKPSIFEVSTFSDVKLD
jgi:photosystem II stability/assembly factor-like uncharacterized protein